MEGLLLFVSLLVGLAMGGLSASLAERKGYAPESYFFLGLFFGPFGLLYVVGLPVKPVAKARAGDYSKAFLDGYSEGAEDYERMIRGERVSDESKAPGDVLAVEQDEWLKGYLQGRYPHHPLLWNQ